MATRSLPPVSTTMASVRLTGSATVSGMALAKRTSPALQGIAAPMTRAAAIIVGFRPSVFPAKWHTRPTASPPARDGPLAAAIAAIAAAASGNVLKAAQATGVSEFAAPFCCRRRR